MSEPTVWTCKAGDDEVVVASPTMVPLKHFAKDSNGITGHWCEAGYELAALSVDPDQQGT